MFPSLGLAELEDPETGERWLIDTANPRIRGRFAQEMKRRREDRIRLFQKLSLDHVELRSGEDHSLALQRFFRARARRMAA
jgi:hypothetical protein